MIITVRQVVMLFQDTVYTQGRACELPSPNHGAEVSIMCKKIYTRRLKTNSYYVSQSVK